MRNAVVVCSSMLVPLVLVACAKRPPQDEPVQLAVGRIETVRAAQRGSIDEFRPAREAVVAGGVCTEVALPKPGVRRLIATFPSRAAPETSISLTVDSSGVVLRHNETRGFPPRSTDRSIPIAARLDSVVQTTVQLDYITGEAILANRGPGQNSAPVLGSVAQVETTGVVGDVAGRQKAALALCTKRRQ